MLETKEKALAKISNLIEAYSGNGCPIDEKIMEELEAVFVLVEDEKINTANLLEKLQREFTRDLVSATLQNEERGLLVTLASCVRCMSGIIAASR